MNDSWRRAKHYWNGIKMEREEKRIEIHLNAEQRKMIEENLSVIQKVICKHVMLNESVEGMVYDDVY